ncbi:GNAT family N-acetyltransferase [Roseomonas elaeocarpi]|uniref:GNAT family N-acetyltransferase n=1 Tax=Roseomonas elaeocarpi TaxID=907779 RepID=A0ABV6JWF7_9PROT
MGPAAASGTATTGSRDPLARDAPRLLPLTALPEGLGVLRAEAAAEGFRFVERLVAAGAAGFGGPGELLLGAFLGDELVAIGGLNRDPYVGDPGTARLRHLYVRPGFRRRGIASAIVQQLLGEAGENVRLVRLRTDTAAGAAFYRRHGFTPVRDAQATHVLPLQRPR